MRYGMKTSAVLAAACFSMLALGASAPMTGAKPGQSAPGFTLEDQNGKAVSLGDYAGKVVVLTWLNRDCPFVQRHLAAKTFTKLSSEYKEKGVVFLAVDSSHTHTTAENLKTAQENGFDFPLLNDAKGSVGHLYDAKTTPQEFVINKDGVVAYSGAIDNDPGGDVSPKVNYVSKALDEVLAGKGVSVAETKSYGCSIKYAE